MNYKVARLIAEEVGSIVDFSIDTKDLWGKFLRIKVRIDITKPLKRGIRLRLANFDTMITALIKYERLPDFCYGCGLIGHSFRECYNSEVRKNIMEGVEPKFGGWLRASPLDRSKFRQKGEDTSEAIPKVQEDIEHVAGVGAEGASRSLPSIPTSSNKRASSLRRNYNGNSGRGSIGYSQGIRTLNFFTEERRPERRRIRLALCWIVEGSVGSQSRACPVCILCWNVRGLGSPRAFLALRKVIRKQSPNLVFLFETRLKGDWAARVKVQLGFSGGLHVDCVGKSGGLMLLWNDVWDVSVLSFSRGHIDVVIKMENNLKWRFTGFYGCPVPSHRTDSWELLRRLKAVNRLPWLCGGDFNEFLHIEEKLGGNERIGPGMFNFRSIVELCDFVDLGFSGPLFTWNNKRGGSRNVQERLDRFFATSQWVNLFSGIKVEHLGFMFSDHRPISAKFVRDKLGLCADRLENWSKVKFGSLKKAIDRKRCEINLLYDRKQSEQVLDAIKSRERELESLLSKEELYWKQRSRVDWLLAGDKNSKFFHRRATARKKKNQISSLLDSRGVRRESEQGMSSVVLDYFSDLFRSIQPSFSDLSAASFFLESKVNAQMAGRLGEAFTRAEVRYAVFEMGPNKAPGPDGFHALFFQKFWNDFKVASLISPSSHSWDLAKLDQVFVAADRDSILEIPLSLGDCADSLIWHFDKTGEYSVKSGYRVAAQEKLSLSGSSSSPDSKWWLALWNLNIPPKIKIFIWRVCHNAIPSLSHALFWCSSVRPIWESTVFWDVLNLQRHISCFDLILWVFVRAKRAEFEEFCMILVNADLVSWSLSLLREFQGTQKVFGSPSQPPRQPCSASWSPPPAGSLKLNTDAAVKSGFSVMGSGAVVRDSQGKVVAASAKPLLGFFPAELGELLALREGLLALFRVVGVSNCHAIPRSRNGMAHSLASLAFSSKEDFCWFNPEPSFLVGLL
ncbi:hypothetical protein ACOSQ2_013940 [Xanthoceras sorbifolium]